MFAESLSFESSTAAAVSTLDGQRLSFLTLKTSAAEKMSKRSSAGNKEILTHPSCPPGDAVRQNSLYDTLPVVLPSSTLHPKGSKLPIRDAISCRPPPWNSFERYSRSNGILCNHPRSALTHSHHRHHICGTFQSLFTYSQPSSFSARLAPSPLYKAERRREDANPLRCGFGTVLEREF
jgi:hypothetical protein